MRIRSVRHKGLRRLLEEDDGRGLPGNLVKRIRNILAVLLAASDMDWSCRTTRLAHPPTLRQACWYVDCIGFWQLAPYF